MSRDRSRGRPRLVVVAHSGGDSDPAPNAHARVAEHVGKVALELAKLARTEGFATLGYLLESVALEAGAEAAAGWQPAAEDSEA
jgi:hypothetical protein